MSEVIAPKRFLTIIYMFIVFAFMLKLVYENVDKVGHKMFYNVNVKCIFIFGFDEFPFQRNFMF